MGSVKTVKNTVKDRSVMIYLMSLFFLMTQILFGLFTGFDRSNPLFVPLLIIPVLGYFISYYVLSAKCEDMIGDYNKLFWTVTIIVRLFQFFYPVGLSDDIYRYLWDGHVQHENMNPFLYSPEASELVGIRTSWWDMINNSSVHSPYPVLAQLLFAGLYSFSHDMNILIIIYRVVLTVFDLGVLFILIKFLEHMNISRTKAILYAWSPLLIFEISGNVHIDIVGIFFLMVSLHLLIIQPLKNWNNELSGIFLCCAILIKVFPIIILPLVIRYWKRRTFLTFGGTSILLHLPYVMDGKIHIVPMGLETFAQSFRFNESLFRIYENFFEGFTSNGGQSARLFYTVLIVGISLFLFWKLDEDNVDTVLTQVTWLMLIALLLGPDVQPWYLLWILPLAILADIRTGILYSVMVLLSYQIYVEYDRSGIWSESPIILLLEYIPVYALIIVELSKWISSNYWIASGVETGNV